MCTSCLALQVATRAADMFHCADGGAKRTGKAPADSGSSSEDTSDEAYSVRHTKKEQEEREKYLTWQGQS